MILRLVDYASDPTTLHSFIDGFLLGQYSKSTKLSLKKNPQNPVVSITEETKESDNRGLSLEKSELQEEPYHQLKLQPEVTKSLTSPKVEFAGCKDKEQRPSLDSGKISNALGKSPLITICFE